MPSPPLAPDDGPIDFEHLKRMTLDDAGLEQEVLAMFAAQSAQLIGRLADLPEDAPTLAHTLKGSARAIGAFAVADAAARLEAVLGRRRRSVRPALRTLRSRGTGADGDRGGAAPVLSAAPPGCRKASPKPIQNSPAKMPPQVFAPTAGAVRIDPL